MRPRNAGDTCAACENFTPPKVRPESATVGGLAEALFSHGECRAHPLFVKRAPSDGCGEFTLKGN